MAVKIPVWLQERWPALDAALSRLTTEQQDEISAICQAEIEYWRTERGASLGSVGNYISFTRKHLGEYFSVLDDTNSWINPKDGEQEHISLKYMNLSKEEWVARKAPTQEKREARNQSRKFLTDPDAVVARAVSLLDSRYWQDIAVALALLTGRRTTEVLVVGSFAPCTRYSVFFQGQLKTRTRVMPAYEIPVLCEASLVLAAVDRLRSLIGDFTIDEDQLGAVADRHFSDIVPPREDANLYTHLFRAVYGCIAVFYFAKPETLDTVYLNRIYGHYWIVEATGQLEADYNATMHYQDYGIADSVILAHGGKRQGVKLGDEGVEVLSAFQEKPVLTTKKGKKVTQTTEETPMIENASQTGYSMIKPKQKTKKRVDLFIEQEKITDSSPYDAALVLLLDRNYLLKTIMGYGVDLDNIALLLAAAAENEDKTDFQALVETLKNLEEIAALLVDARGDVHRIREEAAKAKATTYTAKKKPLPQGPIDYLRDLLEDRRGFLASYKDRSSNRDYETMSLEQLRDNKTTEAAHERFGRAVAAIMDYNGRVAPDARWYINASIICKLVGGKPALADKYIKEHEEIATYHEKQGLTVGYNKRAVHPIYRIAVPERPGEPADEECLRAQIKRYEEREEKRRLARAGRAEDEE